MVWCSAFSELCMRRLCCGPSTWATVGREGESVLELPWFVLLATASLWLTVQVQTVGEATTKAKNGGMTFINIFLQGSWWFSWLKTLRTRAGPWSPCFLFVLLCFFVFCFVLRSRECNGVYLRWRDGDGWIPGAWWLARLPCLLSSRPMRYLLS